MKHFTTTLIILLLIPFLSIAQEDILESKQAEKIYRDYLAAVENAEVEALKKCTTIKFFEEIMEEAEFFDSAADMFSMASDTAVRDLKNTKV